jgi:NADH dehydrogenase
MIAHLEEADPLYSESSRNDLLTIVVAGGGFAGVETVAGIHDFMQSAIRSYSNLHPLQIRVVLVHSGAHLLPELGEPLGGYAEKKLRERGIEVLTQRRLRSITDAGITLDDDVFIGTSFVVWAAGNSPSPVVAALPFANRAGRIDTNPMLQVEMKAGVWALGDCASIPDGNGGFPRPLLSMRCAKRGRQRETLSLQYKNIIASIRGEALKPFSFKTIGQLAAIGHRTGVGRIFGRRFSGFIAWWMWRTVYLSKLPGLEKRLRVALDWTLDLVFAKDTVQYTSFRAFSQSTQLSPFHDPEQSPHDVEPDDAPTRIEFGPGRSIVWKAEPIEGFLIVL